MSIKQIKSLVQFARGTSLIFDSLTTPIPDGVVVFAIDNGAFKLGDGVTLYANLPTLFKYEDLLGAQGGISNLFKTITAADNGKIVVVELDQSTSTVKYAVSNTTLPNLLASISALETANTTQDADIAAVLATALSIDVSINTGMDDNLIVINSGRYMNSGTSIASVQAQVAAQSSNQPGSHLDEPVFYTNSNKNEVANRFKLSDNNTYYVDVIGYNNSVPTPVFSITCSNTNVAIANVSGSLFSVTFNNVTGSLKNDIPVILILSIDNGLGTSTVRKAIVCKIQYQRIIEALCGGNGNDAFQGIDIDSDGNIYAVGYVTGIGYGNEDALIVKFDSDLNIIRKKIYGGAGKDYFTSIKIDSNGYIFCVGWTSSEGTGNTDGLFVKFDKDLNILARKTYGSSVIEEFYDIAIDSIGNIICVGTTRGEGAGNNDASVVKLDNNLNIINRKVYGGTAFEEFNGVAVDSSDNIVCVGYADSSGGGKALIVKFDSNLSIIASKRYGNSNTEEFNGVAIDSDNNIICVGSTRSESIGGDDALIVKFDSNLGILSRKYYGGGNNEILYRVTVDANNNIICVGRTGSEGSSPEEGLIIKFDTSLNFISRKRYGGLGNERVLCVVNDINGNIICAGHTASDGEGGNADCMIIKFPPQIPVGTFVGSIITGLTLADSNLTLANSTLGIADSVLTLAASSLTLANSNLSLGDVTLLFERDFLN